MKFFANIGINSHYSLLNFIDDDEAREELEDKLDPPSDDLFSSFGISMREAASQLRKINGGKEGFYLVDIMHKHYYYCGNLPSGVRDKLIELGIGTREPVTGN